MRMWRWEGVQFRWSDCGTGKRSRGYKLALDAGPWNPSIRRVTSIIIATIADYFSWPAHKWREGDPWGCLRAVLYNRRVRPFVGAMRSSSFECRRDRKARLDKQ